MNNGNASDHSVGLVAVSSWQGWLRHLPRRSEYQQPGYGVSNFTRFFSTLSWRSPKAAFGYFKTDTPRWLREFRVGSITLWDSIRILYETRRAQYVEMFTRWVRQNQNTANYGQGPLMGAITSGFGE